jgi:hypothetical protein
MSGSARITKKDLAKKTHKPHGGSKDSNTHAAKHKSKDDKKLRVLNETIAKAQAKRDKLAKAGK